MRVYVKIGGKHKNICPFCPFCLLKTMAEEAEGADDFVFPYIEYMRARERPMRHIEKEMR
jgi:hypothetical protein